MGNTIPGHISHKSDASVVFSGHACDMKSRTAFTLIERVPMRRTFLVDIVSIPPIVHFGRIA